jgi:hypothetical protein
VYQRDRGAATHPTVAYSRPILGDDRRRRVRWSKLAHCQRRRRYEHPLGGPFHSIAISELLHCGEGAEPVKAVRVEEAIGSAKLNLVAKSGASGIERASQRRSLKAGQAARRTAHVRRTPYSPAPHGLFSHSNHTHATHQPRCYSPGDFVGLPFPGFAGERWQKGTVSAEADSETVRARRMSLSFGGTN